MNTLADCAIARHSDEVSSASISLQPALTAPRQARAFTRQSLITLTLTFHPDALRAKVRDGSGILPVPRSAGREDDCGRGLAIIDALAEYWTSGRVPGGGKWVRACMSSGNGLFDRGR
jgi:hypothetical protein